MEYACLFFNDLKCESPKRFSGLGCWCLEAERRKSEDEPKPLTTKEVIFLGFK